MTARPALSRAEMEVARRVWELKKATVREVHETLSDHRDIDFSTVQTYLRRLADKGYLRTRLDGRTRVYSPKVQRRTVVRETIDDLVERLFGGDTMPLMVHLIEERDVSDDELATLRALIDRLEEQSGKP